MAKSIRGIASGEYFLRRGTNLAALPSEIRPAEGRRFRAVSSLCLGVLAVTGLLNLSVIAASESMTCGAPHRTQNPQVRENAEYPSTSTCGDS